MKKYVTFIGFIIFIFTLGCETFEIYEGHICPPINAECCNGDIETCTIDEVLENCPNFSDENRNLETNRCEPNYVCANHFMTWECLESCNEGQEHCVGFDGIASCTDTQTNPYHCGRCGNECEGGQVCRAGVCVLTCRSGEIMCGSEGRKVCVNPLDSLLYCGASGACSEIDGTQGKSCLPGEICKNGECKIECQEGLILCDDNGVESCINPNTEMKFCGAKGNCKDDETSENSRGTSCEKGKVCSDGICDANCSDDLKRCEVNGESLCADVKTNIAHCGACNAACTTAKVANSSAVVCNSGCKATACKSGYYLNNGTCAANSMTTCGGTNCTQLAGWVDGICTNNICVATRCADNYNLQSGKCIARLDCPIGQKDCGGGCVDVFNSAEHCGACNSTCNLFCHAGYCINDLYNDSYICKDDATHGDCYGRAGYYFDFELMAHFHQSSGHGHIYFDPVYLRTANGAEIIKLGHYYGSENFFCNPFDGFTYTAIADTPQTQVMCLRTASGKYYKLYNVDGLIDGRYRFYWIRTY